MTFDQCNLCTLGSDRSLAASVSLTCASRPCFPGVQCINRRPPHVGYVCGRCPPGLYGNGRVCMKNAKEGKTLVSQKQAPAFKSIRSSRTSQLLPRLPSASNHLPQQQQQQQAIVKSGRFLHASGSKIPLLHLPVLPARSKHPTSSISRANRDNIGRQAPAPGRGGGTGRREALPAPRGGPRAFTTSNGFTVRQSSVPTQQGTTTFTRSSKSFSSIITLPQGTSSMVSTR